MLWVLIRIASAFYEDLTKIIKYHQIHTLIKDEFLVDFSEKLELIEAGKAGLPSCPKELPVIEEPASPVYIKSEPPTPVKPEPPMPQLKKEPSTTLIKKPGNMIRQPSNVVRQPGNVIRQPGNMIRAPKLEIKREAGVMVKTEVDTEPMLVDLKDLAALGQGFNLDPASLTELGLQVYGQNL